MKLVNVNIKDYDVCSKLEHEFDKIMKTFSDYYKPYNIKTYFVREDFFGIYLWGYTLGIETNSPLPQESISITLLCDYHSTIDCGKDLCFRLAVGSERFECKDMSRWDRFISLLEDLTDRTIEELSFDKLRYWGHYA